MNEAVAYESAREVLFDRVRWAVALIAQLVSRGRAKPAPEQPTLLQQLAGLALDTVTAAGIAGAVAKRLEPTVTKLLARDVPQRTGATSAHTILPSKALVALVTDGVKHIIKSAPKAVAGSRNATDDRSNASEVGVTPDGQSFAKRSADPVLAFFASHHDQLADGELHGTAVVVETIQLLRPTLRTAPQHAVAAMTAVRTAIEHQLDYAQALQAEQSVRKWVQAVAIADGAGTANARFDERHPLAKIDGLIDIAIQPSYHDPAKPVAVRGARLDGVKGTVVARFRHQRLSNLGLAVRAAGHFDSPSATLTVVRDAGGSVSYTENTAAEWQQGGRWLERKAVANGRGRDAGWGARIVIEHEVMTKTLEEIGVTNDSTK
ncbi:MAG: hypothetical protein M3680_26460 [Myxococcota bacterium]|nr:hypothetical protein [Myxococcota bacterium]